MKEQVTEVFDLIAKLHQKLGLPPTNQMGGPWVYQVDKHWIFALNGKSEPVKVEPAGAIGWTVHPYHCAVWCNGWAAGEFSPFGGWMAAGAAANEDTFIEALKASLTVPA